MRRGFATDLLGSAGDSRWHECLLYGAQSGQIQGYCRSDSRHPILLQDLQTSQNQRKNGTSGIQDVIRCSKAAGNSLGNQQNTEPVRLRCPLRLSG